MNFVAIIYHKGNTKHPENIDSFLTKICIFAATLPQL
jgi:hypothetical protein